MNDRSDNTACIPQTPQPRARLSKAALAYRLAVAGVFIAAACYRFHWAPAPFFDADGWTYLWSGLRKLTGGHFELLFGREYAYPAFVGIVLFVFGSFSAITFVQHTLGLLGGGILLACCHLLEAIAHDRPHPLRWPAIASPCWAGLALTAVYLWNFNTFYYEHSIRPEAVFPCFALASLLLNLLIIAGKRGDDTRPWVLPVAGANLALCVLLILLRPSFRISALFANIPFALMLLRRQYPLRTRLSVLGLSLVASACIWLPQPLYSAGSRWSARLMSERLFSGHCDLISRQIDMDVADHHTGPYNDDWLRALGTKVSEKLAESRRPENNPWKSLGFNADYIIVTGNPLAAFFPDTLEGDRAMAAFCVRYYIRAALHQPVTMTRKVLTQVVLFYKTGMGLDRLDWRRRFRWRSFKSNGRAETGADHVSPRFFYREAVDQLHPGPPYDTMVAASVDARAYQSECQRLKRSKEKYLNPWLVLIADHVCWMAHVVLVLAALGICGALPFLPEKASALRTLNGAQWLVFAYSFGSCLTTALVFMVVDRYAQTLDALVLVATYASGLFVWRSIRALRSPPRTADQSNLRCSQV